MTVDELVSLASAGESIDAAFARVDARANALQRRHQRVVLVGVTAGFVALACSFASICFTPVVPSLPLLLGEFASSLVMVGAIVHGLVSRYHHHWILQRHRAERLRLLRFSWIVDPQNWDAAPDAGPAMARELRAQVDAVVGAGEPEMKRWYGNAGVADVAMPAHAPSQAFVDAVKRYYVQERLSGQLSYFLDMADRRERLDSVTRILPAVAFGTAVLLSFIHLIIEYVDYRNGGEAIAVPGGWLLYVILILPAFGAAARLLRSAFEFARNRQRFIITAAELERARGRLDIATKPADVARAMLRAEDALAQEHREWLRLMLEAEWYG